MKNKANNICNASNLFETLTITDLKHQLNNKFAEVFGDNSDTKMYFAPGRVNLIGEHTDYNGGHVFPCALTMGTYAVARIRDDDNLRFYSVNFEEIGIIEASISNCEYNSADNWANYPKGIIQTLKIHNFNLKCGLDILYYGTIPNGSGLSSSASIEVLTCFILKDLFGFSYDLILNALMCQYSENHYNGVNCGIMDQFAVAMGKKDHAIFLNTADLSYEYAPVKLNNMKIVIMNTNKKRSLTDSKYNERRQECELALAEINNAVSANSAKCNTQSDTAGKYSSAPNNCVRINQPISTLGDLTPAEFEAVKSSTSNETLIKRARHAVYENDRTIKAVGALKDNNLEEFGKLMTASHNSLKNDYEVTGLELDTLVASALKQPGVIGARMTGAGFGGCAISIVHEDYIDAFIENVGKEYFETIGYNASFYTAKISDGPKCC